LQPKQRVSFTCIEEHIYLQFFKSQHQENGNVMGFMSKIKLTQSKVKSTFHSLAFHSCQHCWSSLHQKVCEDSLVYFKALTAVRHVWCPRVTKLALQVLSGC